MAVTAATKAEMRNETITAGLTKHNSLEHLLHRIKAFLNAEFLQTCYATTTPGTFPEA